MIAHPTIPTELRATVPTALIGSLDTRDMEAVVTADQFSASASVVGYLFQCKYALLASLERMDGRPLLVELETLDDISFPPGLSPMELLQLKHHQGNNPPNLGTSSKDLWSSLRVWAERLKDGILEEDARLYLVTTSACSPDSGPSLLRAVDRDVDQAERLLSSYASDSDAAGTKAGRDLYLGLPQSKRLALLDRIFILDNQPHIDDLDERLKQVLRPARPSKVDYVLESLSEWWYRRCAEHLSGKNPGPISATEIDFKLEAIGDALSADNLPIDVDEPDELDLGDFANRQFARQLGLLPVSSQRVLQAAKDYMRAFTQRSRWLGAEILTVGDLGDYENRLVSEWRLRYNVMCDDMGPSAAADEMEREAKNLYRWIELEADFPIRPRCTASFVTRGSYHMLSDELRVGWHPRFEELLATAITPESA